MAEDLKVMHYNNGASIPNVADDATWQHLITAAYRNYNNSSNDTIYGKLYNYYTLAGNLCPTGWHVPSLAEWNVLINYLGGANIAGRKLKTNSDLWVNPNNGATNESGFTAIPGGYCNPSPFGRGINGYWWTTTQQYPEVPIAWYVTITNATLDAFTNVDLMTDGCCVRCIKDN